MFRFLFVRALRRYYPFVRLPTDVHVGRVVCSLHQPVPQLVAVDICGASRFSRVEFSSMPGVSGCAGLTQHSRGVLDDVAFRFTEQRRRPER